MLKITPLAIYRKNHIGHPSTTLIKNDRQDWFDKTLKWVVDIEFYIRLLREKKSFHAINKSLICIGMGAEQITQTAFYNKQIELPENFYLLNKLGKNALKNIFVYDHFWRLMRNLDIKSVDEIKTYTTDMAIPKEIESMIQKIQKSGAAHLKRNGALSKIGMLMRFGIYRLGF